jgi:predicted O-linked N-acetylglucosamine transferase (SPINDLY family)
MGADYSDYVLADATVIPEDQCAFFTEQVVWLPDCYQINDDKRKIAERTPTRRDCGLPEDAFVYCCFNNTYKIGPDVFDIWMRLLKETKNSVLWLFDGNSPSAAQLCRDNLRREAESRGVAATRLVFAERAPMADHLARHRLADLFLDTLPYNAHTTASDALWAGLPVLTRLGETFAGRVAASLLRAVGLEELITHSPEEYEALALKLARDASYLASIKDKLARNRTTAPLFDTARATRRIEAAYTMMWQRYQAGEPAKPASAAAKPIRIS